MWGAFTVTKRAWLPWFWLAPLCFLVVCLCLCHKESLVVFWEECQFFISKYVGARILMTIFLQVPIYCWSHSLVSYFSMLFHLYNKVEKMREEKIDVMYNECSIWVSFSQYGSQNYGIGCCFFDNQQVEHDSGVCFVLFLYIFFYSSSYHHMHVSNDT